MASLSLPPSPFLAPCLRPRPLRRHPHPQQGVGVRSVQAQAQAQVQPYPPPPPPPQPQPQPHASLPLLSFDGARLGSASLRLRSAPPSTARAVVHRALITDQQNARRGTASTLTRGEVRGGGRKPYQQKKSGRARRGSQRTPLRPGGGIIFGPKPRDWSIKINRKEKRLALSTALSSAAAAADAFVIEDFAGQFETGPRTRDLVAAMRRWGLDPTEKALLLMMDLPRNVWLSGRNIGSLKLLTPRTLNLFDILDARKLVFTVSALHYLNFMYGPNSDDSLDVDSFDDGDEDEDEAEAAAG